MPLTLSFADNEPLLPFLTVSPSLETQVGSPTIQKSIFSFLFFYASITLTVPSTAIPSSSEVINKPIEPL